RICAIASTSRKWPRNWLPSPCPFEAPRTSPAISTNSSCVGTIFADLANRAQTSSRSSGTATRPTLGSRVENGYFVASATWVAVKALNRADLPTFGRPTIPQLKPMMSLRKDKDRSRSGHAGSIYGDAGKNPAATLSPHQFLEIINTIPAKAGTHRSADGAFDKWVPAFAGM